MKRLFRYILYREVYRYLRQLGRDSSNDSSDPVEPDKAEEERPLRERYSELDMSQFPDDGQPLETPGQLKAALQQMDPYEFEYFVGDLWERMGWETEVSTESADQGVDVTARKSLPYDQVTLIQAKRYGPNTTVGSPDIQQYASLKNQYDGVDKVVVVTTNEFTQQARELAQRLNVKLINGDDLIALIDEHEAGDLVVEYLDFLALAEETAEADTVQTTEATPEAPAPAENQEPADPHGVSGPPSRKWEGAIAGSVVAWILVIATLEMLPETFAGIAILILTGLLPFVIYRDTETIGEYTNWPKYRWLYVVGGVIWFLSIVVGIIYLWQRRKAMQSLSTS